MPRTRTCREGRAGLGPGQPRPGCPEKGAGFRSPVASAPLPPPTASSVYPHLPPAVPGLPGEPPTLPLHSGLTGMPCSWGLSSRLWSSFLEASIFSWSAASTMYLGGGRWGQADTTGCGVGGEGAAAALARHPGSPPPGMAQAGALRMSSELMGVRTCRGCCGRPLSHPPDLWRSCRSGGSAGPHRIRPKSFPE